MARDRKLVAIADGLRATCTGALTGPATVLTAGHCLYNAKTKSYFPVASVQFLLGYDRGSYVAAAWRSPAGGKTRAVSLRFRVTDDTGADARI
jgi:V8-like Glu-specific endopeptidase